MEILYVHYVYCYKRRLPIRLRENNRCYGNMFLELVKGSGRFNFSAKDFLDNDDIVFMSHENKAGFYFYSPIKFWCTLCE